MDVFTQFHFLRPLWLLAFIPLFLIAYQLIKRQRSNTGLDHIIAPELLSHLRSGNQKKSSKNAPQWLLTILIATSIVALAGPVWQKLPQAVFQTDSALIIALDLSPSMRAEDNAPSRIKRAQLKIQALLERRQEGLTALVVYAGEAHMVTPFTDDVKTITNLLPTLVPGLLPIPGSNTEMAIELTKDQLGNSGITKASLLLVTDGVATDAISAISQNWDERLSLTILGIGTDRGATIPSSNGYLRDNTGELIIAKRDSTNLENLAAKTGGYYLPLQADDGDIQFIEQVIDRDFSARQSQTTADNSTQYDQWFEVGPTLILLTLPFFALAFRRGWLLSLLITGSFLSFTAPQMAHASLWESLWKNKDQRALDAWRAKNYEKAESLFKNPQWQGSAAYKNNDFEAALKAFDNDPTAIGQYNKGNALANLGELERAVDAYEQALIQNPEFKEAKENKRIIEKLIEQQKKEQEQASKNQEQNSEQQNDSENNDSEQADNHQNNADENQPQPNEQENGEQTQPEENQQNTEQSENNTEPQAEASPVDENQIPLPDDLTQEEQQAMQQWLRKIPDDPSGLLRRKFEYEFNKRRQLYQQGQWELPKNNAHERY